jgi:3-hydroxyacyl-[acyl-carrier-protein] dehydratase
LYSSAMLESSFGAEMEHIDLDLYLRQASPFRFVDEVRFCEEEGVIKSSRLYVGDEGFFTGHFPGEPIVPGVILVESMAQSCRAWLNKKLGRKAKGFIASIEKAKFLKPVRPGDMVAMLARPINPISDDSGSSSRFCRFSCLSRCGDQDVAKASVTLYQAITESVEQ